MNDPVRSPSSIPIPDDVRLAAANRAGKLIEYWDLSDEGTALMADDPADVEVFVSPVIDEILEAAAPKLYAHWAEGRVEAVARALHDRMFPAGQTVGWDNLIEDSRESWRQGARAALGLEDRT